MKEKRLREFFLQEKRSKKIEQKLSERIRKAD